VSCTTADSDADSFTIGYVHHQTTTYHTRMHIWHEHTGLAVRYSVLWHCWSVNRKGIRPVPSTRL